MLESRTISLLMNQFWCCANCFIALTVLVLLFSLILLLILLRRWKNLTFENNLTKFLVIPGTLPSTCLQMNSCVLRSISGPALILFLPCSRLNWMLQTLVIPTTAGTASRSFPLDLLAMKDPELAAQASQLTNLLQTEFQADTCLDQSPRSPLVHLLELDPEWLSLPPLLPSQEH